MIRAIYFCSYDTESPSGGVAVISEQAAALRQMGF